jgi:hypothetical protein
MTTQWLSIVDFARHYNLSDMTVRRRIKNGKLQAILREGKYYIPHGEGHEEAYTAPASPHSPAPVPAPVFTAPTVKTEVSLDSERVPLPSPTPQVVVKAITPPHAEARGLSAENASLVEFCQAALAKFDRVEEQLKGQFQGTIVALEEKIKHLEAALELSKLRETRSLQEVQDLQLLLQMMEQPSP